MEKLDTVRKKNKKTNEVDNKKNSILDTLVVFVSILVVLCLGYLVLNPIKEDAESRNVTRTVDLSSLLTAIGYYADKYGEIPGNIPLSYGCGSEICKTDAKDCSGLVDLSSLKEFITMPVDPIGQTENGTGYYISQNGEGSVAVCAPYSERNVSMIFYKYVY